MNWKSFFKPDTSKIILTIWLIVIGFSLSILGYRDTTTLILLAILTPPVFILEIISDSQATITSYSLTQTIGVTILILNIVYSYLLASFIFYHIRKKKRS